MTPLLGVPVIWWLIALAIVCGTAVEIAQSRRRP